MLKLTGWLWMAVIAAVFAGSAVLFLTSRIGSNTSSFDNVEGKTHQSPRHPEWAITIIKDGLPNLHKVSGNLYRGAQPTAAGIIQLKSMGVKTIIDLRAFHSDRGEIGNIEIQYEHIPIKTWHPEEEDIIKFLKIVTDNEKIPVFVHCQHGADRTGLMCAIYRVVVCDWTKQAAAEELVYGGYGYHKVWQNLIDYFMNLDIEKIKKDAGVRSVSSKTK